MSGTLRPTCGGSNRYSDAKCGLQAGWGTDHYGEGPCRHHDVEHKAKAPLPMSLEDMPSASEPIEIEADAAMLAEIQNTYGHVVWLRAEYRVLEASNRLFTVRGRQVSEQYHWERKQLADLSKFAISTNLLERRIRIAEKHGDTFVQCVTDALRSVALDEELHSKVLHAIAAQLRRHLGSRQPIDARAIEVGQGTITTESLTRWSDEDEEIDELAEAQQHFDRFQDMRRQFAS